MYFAITSSVTFPELQQKISEVVLSSDFLKISTARREGFHGIFTALARAGMEMRRFAKLARYTSSWYGCRSLQHA
jgi:hypothetical protein